MIAINLFATISNLQNKEAVTMKCLALEIILGRIGMCLRGSILKIAKQRHARFT